MTEGEPTRALGLMAPFLTKSQVTELCSGRLYEEYRTRKMQLFRWELERALWEQRQIARENAGRETRFVDGLGQHKMCIHPFLRELMRRRYGDDCWKDSDFEKDTWRKSPELRVPSPAPRFFPVNGFKNSRASREGGAGDGARGNPATAAGAPADRQALQPLGAGSAHEIPASPCLLEEGATC